MTETPINFQPDWISVPGETIADLLDERGWSQSEFAQRADYTTKHVSQLVSGKAAITEDTALRLERVLGGTAAFWLSRESQYREALTRADEMEALESQVDWLQELPIAHMVKYGWIRRFRDKAQQVAECLKFFGVASVSAWRKRYLIPLEEYAAFRSSPKLEKKHGAVAAWLREGERVASSRQCVPFNADAFRQELHRLRTLTNVVEPSSFIPELEALCERVGVSVVLRPAPTGCPVTGATKWLSRNHALLMLSLRYRWNDHLWFAFFHEAGHLLLHGRRMMFLELGSIDGEAEKEADKFASDLLIPPEAAEMLKYLPPRKAEVSRFAESIGIAPGIVVGRMQHDGLLPRSYLNGLKVRYEWSS